MEIQRERERKSSIILFGWCCHYCVIVFYTLCCWWWWCFVLFCFLSLFVPLCFAGTMHAVNMIFSGENREKMCVQYKAIHTCLCAYTFQLKLILKIETPGIKGREWERMDIWWVLRMPFIVHIWNVSTEQAIVSRCFQRSLLEFFLFRMLCYTFLLALSFHHFLWFFFFIFSRLSRIKLRLLFVFCLWKYLWM